MCRHPIGYRQRLYQYLGITRILMIQSAYVFVDSRGYGSAASHVISLSLPDFYTWLASLVLPASGCLCQCYFCFVHFVCIYCCMTSWHSWHVIYKSWIHSSLYRIPCSQPCQADSYMMISMYEYVRTALNVVPFTCHVPFAALPLNMFCAGKSLDAASPWAHQIRQKSGAHNKCRPRNGEAAMHKAPLCMCLSENARTTCR